MQQIVNIVFLIGILVAFGASIWMVVLAGIEDGRHVLLWVFVPFYSVYYIFSRWDVMRKPFLVFSAGVVMVVVPLSFG